MEIIIFLYNIVLLVIFGAVCTLSMACWHKQKSRLYAAVGLLFFVYICDNTIIYMTEFISWFSMKYDSQFMSVPAFKTISFLSQTACTMYICCTLLKRRMSLLHYTVILIQGLILMFVPMMPDSAYKVWLYYLPFQIYQYWISSYGLKIIKLEPELGESGSGQVLKRMLRLTLIFSVLILIEDTIVIFNFDTYTKLIVRINNRNICEDILTLIYSYYVIRTLLELLGGEWITGSFSTEPEPITSGKRAGADGISEVVAEVKPAQQMIYSDPDPEEEMIDRFSDKYGLTTREQEIFSYLIRDKSNQEICEELCISIGTVKTHIHNIFGKVDAVKRSQVVRVYKEFCRGK